MAGIKSMLVAQINVPPLPPGLMLNSPCHGLIGNKMGYVVGHIYSMFNNCSEISNSSSRRP